MKAYTSKMLNEIQENLNPDLEVFYNKNCGRSKLYCDSYNALIHDTMNSELLEKTKASELHKLAKLKQRTRSQKKKRYYNNCADMVETKMWMNGSYADQYCFQDILLNHTMFSAEQWDATYKGKSFEEVEQERLQAVHDWAWDLNTLMIDYPGLEKRTVRSIFANFQLDLTLDILRVIKELYNYDIDRQTFSVLENLADKSIFSSTGERIAAEPKDTTKVVVFGNEDGSRRTVISFDKAVFDGKKSIKLFDSKDQDIMSFFIKETMRNATTQRPIMIEESEITRAIVANPNRKLSKSDYDDTINRIFKLSHATVDFYADNEWRGGFQLIGGTKRIENQGKKYLEYWPSEYLMEQVESNCIMRLPADIRFQLKSEVAKLLYLPIMQQRIKIYKLIKNHKKENGEYKVVFNYSDFLRFVNFGKGNKKDGRRAIIDALYEYKELQTLIIDFEYRKVEDTFTIIFTKLSDEEIKDLDFMFDGDTNSKKLSDDIVGQVLLSDIMKE